MKVLVEQNEFFPEWILRIPKIFTVTRTTSRTVSQEEVAEAARYLVCNLPKIQKVPAAGWALNFEGVAVELIVSVESLDEEKVNRKPYGAAPVRIPAEEIGVGVARTVVDSVVSIFKGQTVRKLCMNLRQRAHSERR